MKIPNLITSKSIQKEIILITTIPLIVALILISFMSIVNKKQSEEDLIRNRVESIITLIEEGKISTDIAQDGEELEQIINEKVIHSTIQTRNGNVLYHYETEYQPEVTEEHMSRAMEGYVVTVEEKINDERVLSFFYPLVIEERIIGVFEVSLEFKESAKRIRQYSIQIIAINLFAFTLAILIINAFSKRVLTNRIKNLEEGTKKITAGKISWQVQEDGADEISSLGKSFNTMTSMLRQSQKKLEEYNKELEEKVEQRTKKLKKVNEKLKFLDKQKDAFISISAHELKTPLTSIKGFAQILQQPNIIKSNKQRTHYINLIEKNSQRLYELVLDIVDSSRIALGKIKIEKQKINTKELFKEIKESMTVIIEKKNLKAEFKIENKIPPIQGDNARVMQVLRNLIINAVHFTSKGKISLHVQKKGSYVEFAVTDTGEGIPKNKQKNLFSRFYQADSSHTRKVQGSGLGLSISRGLVELMKGKIWFKSKEGEGTTFFFTIPIYKKRK